MLKILITVVIAAGLMAGGTLSAFAGSGELNSKDATLSVDTSKVEAILDELEILELMPVPLPGKVVSIDGGFQGVWGPDNEISATPSGVVAGVYGTVEQPDGTRSGFFTGLWFLKNNREGGYLAGRYGNGQFEGRWRCLETGVGGPVRGKYAPSDDVADAVVHHFAGRWATQDGQQTGYLKGTWAPLVLAQVEGRFAGQWVHDPTVSATEVAFDGSLWGTHGVLKLADGSSIHLFKGSASSSNERAQVRLGGLILRGKFYGLWKGANSNAHGYLKGVWASHRFKGVWGHVGHSPQGRLWGRYGPFPTPEQVEAKPLPTETPVPMKATTAVTIK